MEREELIEKYGIDVLKLEKEQEKLAKQLEIKDKIDFSLADNFGAFFNTFIKNKILSCVIVCRPVLEKDNNKKGYEIIDRAYAFEKVNFPYLAGFRAYRELPAMMLAFNKLNERPDVVFISAQGIIHPRLGLASHFALSAGVPVIGVSNSVFGCEIKGGDILKGRKKVGKVLKTKPGSRPIYVSPGNLISIKTAYELSKSFINLPHKFPEPMHLARKYAGGVEGELKG